MHGYCDDAKHSEDRRWITQGPPSLPQPTPTRRGTCFLLDLKYIPLELECACAWSSSGSLSVHQSILIVHQSKYMVGNWRECRTLVLFWSQVCDTGQYICFVSCASISRWPLRINKKSINQGVWLEIGSSASWQTAHHDLLPLEPSRYLHPSYLVWLAITNSGCHCCS